MNRIICQCRSFLELNNEAKYLRYFWTCKMQKIFMIFTVLLKICRNFVWPLDFVIWQTFKTFMWWSSLDSHISWCFSKSMDLVRLVSTCLWQQWSSNGHFWREAFFNWTMAWFGELIKRKKFSNIKSDFSISSRWLIVKFVIIPFGLFASDINFSCIYHLVYQWAA